jgi:hypothetical protein
LILLVIIEHSDFAHVVRIRRMPATADDPLYDEMVRFLEPGEIDLIGIIIDTQFDRSEDLEVHELTVELNDIIAAHSGEGEAYIYAGNDSSSFASNQYQGRALTDDAFVWECQHLVRDGSFTLVFYYEADATQAAIIDAVTALPAVTSVTPVP